MRDFGSSIGCRIAKQCVKESGCLREVWRLCAVPKRNSIHALSERWPQCSQIPGCIGFHQPCRCQSAVCVG